MKGYGMRGEMNPQKEQKAKMSNDKGKSAKKDSKKGHDMSPACKEAKGEAVWQNMRNK